MNKTSNIKLTYDISDTEKMYAEQALITFDALIDQITVFTDHLDKIYIPFKDSQDITPQQIWSVRAELRGVRDLSIDYLKTIKKIAFKSVKLMSQFGSDTSIEKIMTSFNMALNDLNKQFERYLSLFKNIQATDFKPNVVRCIESIKKESVQLKQIIEERLKSHIEEEILDKNWIDSDKDLNFDLKTQLPFEKQLIEIQNRKIKQF